MIDTLRNEYTKLSEFDKKILCFSGKIIIAETSKILILLLFFSFLHKVPELLFSMAILIPIRCQIGGLHFKTYIGCLIITLAIFTTAIIILPALLQPSPLTLAGALFFCAVICVYIGPIINPTRPKLTPSQTKRCKYIACNFILCYIMLSFALHFNHYIVCGIWIIIIQIMQLIVANILLKRRKFS